MMDELECPIFIIELSNYFVIVASEICNNYLIRLISFQLLLDRRFGVVNRLLATLYDGRKCEWS